MQHQTAGWGKLEALNMLIELGADLNRKDKRGQ